MTEYAIGLVALIAVGGGTGAVLRYAIAQVVLSRRLRRGLSRRSGFPLATFVANLFACLLAGIVIGLENRFDLDVKWHVALILGFCGGLSTMSTFALELLQLVTKHKTLDALAYLSLSAGGGIGLLVLGWLAVTM
ncbi:CrcB family protein [Micrococcales bacterium 31B]|nr:CrcB family protein [Micrococcales bacterium 31B]